MPTWGHYGLLEKSVRGKVFQGDFHPMSGETLPQHVEVFDEVIHRGVVAVVQRMNAFREVHTPVEKQGGFRRGWFEHEEVRLGMICAEEEGPQLVHAAGDAASSQVKRHLGFHTERIEVFAFLRQGGNAPAKPPVPTVK